MERESIKISIMQKLTCTTHLKQIKWTSHSLSTENSIISTTP